MSLHREHALPGERAAAERVCRADLAGRPSRGGDGTLAVVAVALRSLRRRPLGNTLIVLGVAAAAIGSGVAGLGAGGTAVGIAAGAALLYSGFVLGGRPSSQPSQSRNVPSASKLPERTA